MLSYCEKKAFTGFSTTKYSVSAKHYKGMTSYCVDQGQYGNAMHGAVRAGVEHTTLVGGQTFQWDRADCCAHLF